MKVPVPCDALKNVVVVAVMMLFACARQAGPPDQVTFVAEWSALRDRWHAEEGNDVRREKVEHDARVFFQTQRTMSGWQGKVVAVKTALGSSWIEVENSGVTFVLRPPDGWEERFRENVLVKLNPGDRVAFDGTFKAELSLTIAGALREPELSVTLSNIRRLH